MSSDVDVVVSIDGASPDELRQLRAWLLAEDELRGRVQLVERPPEAGTLGPVLETLRVLADPGGAVLGSVLVAWVKHHRSSVRVTVSGSGGQRVSIEAERVRFMDADDLGNLADRIASLARAGGPSPLAGPRPPAD